MKNESVADVLFASRGESRRLRTAAIAAILVHFAIFAVVVPAHRRIFDVKSRQAVVIRRYRPPKPPEVTKPVHKRVSRVPIPDPTPDEPELILEESLDEIVPPPDPDTEFVVTAPSSVPEPEELSAAVDMSTEGLEPPRPIRRVQPRYDPERARRGVQGRVDIQIVIDESGKVEFARVINGTEDEELDRLAVVAVRQWEFAPATLSGEAVPVRAVVTINYRIY